MRVRMIGVLSLGLALAPAAGLHGQSAADARSPATPEVRASATASRSVPPDLAVVTLSFSAVGSTPLAAGEGVSVRAEKVRRALQALGIPRDSLVTGSRWYWWRGRVDVIEGASRYERIPGAPPGADARLVRDTTYRAHDAIEVRIRDLRLVGPAIDSALALGVMDISPIRFVATDIAAAREAALREATVAARAQAVAMASANGGQLGRALVLSNEPMSTDRYADLIAPSAAALAGEGTTVIRPAVTVSATVYGRWELLPPP